MERRIPRGRRPSVEQCERRELLSAITDVMADNSLVSHGSSSAQATQALIVAASQTGGSSSFVPSTTSIALRQNQGPLLNPDGSINNLALAPTGTLTPRQIRRERFTAKFTGTYTVGAGRTSTESIQTFIAAAGTTNTMLHSDIQLLLVTPKDPTDPIGGTSAIFDRNLNSNTVLGFDLSAPQQNVNKAGLPNDIPTVSVDANSSAGVYDEAYSQGVINIRYIPDGRHTRGVISQGTAVVTIHAQIYAPNVDFILRNSNIDP
jgi:hypothetical protein